jgi:antitoxin ParD1/3/4
MIDIVVTLPAMLKALVDARVAEGGYLDAGEYVRDLMRRDQERRDQERENWLEVAIADAQPTGLEAEPDDVAEALDREYPSRG